MGLDIHIYKDSKEDKLRYEFRNGTVSVDSGLLTDIRDVIAGLNHEGRRLMDMGEDLRAKLHWTPSDSVIAAVHSSEKPYEEPEEREKLKVLQGLTPVFHLSY